MLFSLAIVLSKLASSTVRENGIVLCTGQQMRHLLISNMAFHLYFMQKQ